MQIDERAVVRHYGTSGLLDALRQGLAAQGLSPERVSVDDLAAADEFHIGGRQATIEFHDQLGWKADHALLDVGCGLGGTARYVASRHGARVTGIDLTPEYVSTGQAVNEWVGLSDRIGLQVGSALDLPFVDASFDGAYMMHVGMNIPDKPALFRGVARVLRPGAVFGVYDVMRAGDGEVAYPVPWAETADTSALATPADYEGALAGAGFEVTTSRDRRAFAVEFFERLRARLAGAEGPPPIGLHLVLGPAAQDKIRNMIAAIASGAIAPVEMVAVRRR